MEVFNTTHKNGLQPQTNSSTISLYSFNLIVLSLHSFNLIEGETASSVSWWSSDCLLAYFLEEN